MEPEGSAPSRPSRLTRLTIRGIAWTLPTSLASRVLGLVGTLLLARYLSPGEYGEVTAAAIVMLTASSVTTFGVGIYLVANADASRDEVFHATCLFLATGLVSILAMVAASGPLGTYFDANLERFLVPLALGAALDRVAFIPERMLVRRLRFRWLSISRAGAEVAYTAVSLGSAMLGAGAMAIAWGGLARSAVRFAAIVPAVGWRAWLEPHRIRLSTMLRIIRFGMNVSVGSVANFLLRRWDNLLVSRYYGPGVMGAYNYAYNLADTPAVAVGEQVIDVLGASFPQAEVERRPLALVRAWTMVSLIMLPLAFGLGSIGETVVRTFFDARWQSAGAMLAVLSVIAAARPLGELARSYLFACDRSLTAAWLEWLALGALVLLLSSVGRLGIGWACASVGAVFVLRAMASIWVVSRADGLTMPTFLRPLVGPLAACAAMSASIAIVRPWLQGMAPALQLVVEILLGALVYLAGAALLFRRAAGDLLGLARTALKGG